MIYEIRGKQVMLASDLAMLSVYETKYLNRQGQRNITKLSGNHCFQLTEEEYKELQFQLETANNMSITLPYAFTEQGITMLAPILRTKVAEEVSIRIKEGKNR